MAQFVPHLHRLPGISGAPGIAPSGGLEFSGTHPLARGLQFYVPFLGDTKPIDYAYGSALSQQGAVAQIVTDRGAALYVPGASNTGLSVDANTTSGQVTNAMCGAMTFIAWVKPTDFSTYRGVFGQTFSGAPSPLDIYLNSGNGKLSVNRGYAYSSTGTFFLYNSNGPLVPAGVTSQIAFTADAGNTTLTYFLNGAQTATETGVTGGDGLHSLGGSPNPPVIGYRSDNVTLFLGSLGPMSIYNRILSAGEITALYREPYAVLKPKAGWPARHFVPAAAAVTARRPRITVIA